MIPIDLRRARWLSWKALILLGIGALHGCFPELPDVSDGEDAHDTLGDGTLVLTAPANVTASSDSVESVTIRWDPVANASGYRVEACDTPCSDGWLELGVVSAPPLEDTGLDPAPLPAAPTLVLFEATPSALTFEIQSPPAKPGPERSYRVIALAGDLVSSPSDLAAGRRAAPPVQGFSASGDGAAWWSIGSSPRFTYTDAPPPTLSAGVVAASQGEFSDWVQLTLSGTTATDGESVTLRVRSETSSGPSSASDPVVASRPAPPMWTIHWERSDTSEPDAFVLVPGATGTVWNDTDAPADGTARYYRAVVSAQGAPVVRTDAAIGFRKPPPGAIANLRATTDRPDGITVSWDGVGGATGYRIYRNSGLVAEVSPSETSWTDTAEALAVQGSWQPVSELEATATTATIDLTWKLPTRPVGPDASYEVAPVNLSGEGPRSGSVIGRRAAPMAESVEVEVEDGVRGDVLDAGPLGTAWSDRAAPHPEITAGETTISAGTHRAFVALRNSRAGVLAAPVTYRVRLKLEDGAHTPWSGTIQASRSYGPLQHAWQRMTATNGNYVGISGATGSSHDDATAPQDGSPVTYRLLLRAEGAADVATAPASGYRLALTSVSAGRDHACALATDGAVWCWGANEAGQLGRGTLSTREAAPERVPGLTTATQVSAGDSHTCARSTHGTVWCWGANNRGQLGDGTEVTRPSAVSVQGLASVVEVASGNEHTCARTSGGEVWCWGRNDSGQVGDGTTSTRPTPTRVQMRSASGTVPLTGAVSLASVGEATCAIRATSPSTSVWCWSSGLVVGADQQWGENVAVSSGKSGLSTLAAGRGGSHACGLGTNGTWCWGSDGLREISGGLLSQPGWSGTDTSQSGPAQLTLFTNIVRVATGIGTTCIHDTTGTVACWGEGNQERSLDGIHQTSLQNVSSLAVFGRSGNITGIFTSNHDVYLLTGNGAAPIMFP